MATKTTPSAEREGQPERGHLLAVANQQDVADQHRMVPRLALDRREPRELPELVRGCPDQRQLPSSDSTSNKSWSANRTS